MVNELTVDRARHDIRIGPAGWSYKDWEGVVYPSHGSRFDHLAYLAQYFDVIEVNSTFYRIPPVTHATSWVRRVRANDRFRFAIKLFRGFTHEATMPTALDVRAFRNMLDPIHQEGRLGALLVQFPWSFRAGKSEERLRAVFDAFAGYPIALEVRHGSFETDGFHSFLRDAGVSIVDIDQPVFGSSIRPASTLTGPIGYVRLHGRNYEKWFSHEESWERYDYLYSSEELQPWVARVEQMAERADVYVITNNHYRGQAIVNAIDLERALGQRSDVPPALETRYGERVAPG